MAFSFDFPLDRVAVVRSRGEVRLRFAAGDDWLGCDWVEILWAFCCAMAGLLWG